VPIIPKRCKCCCSDVTGIDVASVRRDQCFGRYLRRADDPSRRFRTCVRNRSRPAGRIPPATAGGRVVVPRNSVGTCPTLA
jgi:hypothetical protein